MGKLNPERRRTRAPAKADNAGQRRLVCIGIEAETAVTDAARRFDRRLLDDDKSGARQRQRTQGWRCQSFAAPFSALYWHIGDTAIRLARVMPPSVSGSNREGVPFIRSTGQSPR